jgi:hypothetical protein
LTRIYQYTSSEIFPIVLITLIVFCASQTIVTLAKAEAEMTSEACDTSQMTIGP